MGLAFVGNDVVDLASPALSLRAAGGEDALRRWRQRHLTDREQAAAASFWSLFAAKEAAWKAFAQAGIEGARGAFREFDVDLGRRTVRHLPSGLSAEIAQIDEGPDCVHCVVVLGETAAASLSFAVFPVPAGVQAGEAAREGLVDLAAAALGGSRARFAVAWRNGAPALLEAGRWPEAGVSLAHSGRYAAASLLRVSS